MKKEDNKIEELKEKLQKAKETLNQEKTFSILEKLTSEYKKENKFPQAKKYALELLPFIEMKKNEKKLGDHLVVTGTLHYKTAEYNIAIEYYSKALEIFQKQNDDLNVAETFYLMGATFYVSGKFEESASNLFSALEIYDKNKKQLEKPKYSLENERYADTLKFLGLIHIEFKQFEKSRKYLLLSLELSEKMNNLTGISNILNNLGYSYMKEKKGDIQQSLKYYKRAFDIAEKLDSKERMTLFLNNIGSVYEQLQQPEKALQFYKKALAIVEAGNFVRYKAGFLSHIGSTYFRMENYEQAIDYVKQSLEYSHQQNIPKQISESYKLLCAIYEKQQNYKIALEYHKQYFELEKKLLNKEMVGKVTGLQNRYEESSKKIIDLKNRCSLVSKALKKSIQTEFIGTSQKIKKVMEMAMTAANYPDTNVLILGESGTGKEIIANIIHYASIRKSHLIVAVNMGSIPATLAESEFFGYLKGSFTGAVSDKIGFVELADEGTLFLDEIADTPASLQTTFLRVLENKRIRKIGEKKEKQINFRVIAATNKDINDLVEKTHFRLDLLYRINTIEIKIPPLRERPEDIKPLVEFYIRELSQTLKIPIPKIDFAVFDKLQGYSFPGNVRELKNMVERALILSDDGILKPEYFSLKDEKGPEKIIERAFQPRTIQEMENKMIADTMKETNNNQTKTAKILGISFSTLKRKLKKN